MTEADHCTKLSCGWERMWRVRRAGSAGVHVYTFKLLGWQNSSLGLTTSDLALNTASRIVVCTPTQTASPQIMHAVLPCMSFWVEARGHRHVGLRLNTHGSDMLACC